MFCPSCGAESVHELTYCNRCGANLKSPANSAGVPSTKLVGVAWAISLAVTAVTLAGFGMIFSLARTLIVMGQGVSEGGMALFFCALLMILIIDGLLIRQLSRALSMPRISRDEAQRKELKPPPQDIPQIQAPRVSAGSVTDHTTRTFAEKSGVRETERP
jgi:hypothetical protein